MGLDFLIFLFFLPDVIITIYLIGREVLLNGHFSPLYPSSILFFYFHFFLVVTFYIIFFFFLLNVFYLFFIIFPSLIIEGEHLLNANWPVQTAINIDRTVCNAIQLVRRCTSTINKKHATFCRKGHAKAES